MTRLPPELDRPEVLAYLAALLAWREGDPVPPQPQQLTVPLETLFGWLADPAVRRHVVERLSVLVPHPERKLKRTRHR